jgi:hypothetical protein
MLPLTMSGGPYTYDPESKRFVMRPSAEPPREPLADLPDSSDDPSLPSPRVKPPPSRIRRRLVMWLVSLVLFLAWLLLLAMWLRQGSSRIGAPSASSRSIAEEFPKETFSK